MCACLFAFHIVPKAYYRYVMHDCVCDTCVSAFYTVLCDLNNVQAPSVYRMHVCVHIFVTFFPRLVCDLVHLIQ